MAAKFILLLKWIYVNTKIIEVLDWCYCLLPLSKSSVQPLDVRLRYQYSAPCNSPNSPEQENEKSFRMIPLLELI